MTIAITGATSMIGVATIKACIEKQISVIAFVRKDSDKISRIKDFPSIDIVYCDLHEMSTFFSNNLHSDIFIHLAWAFTDKKGRNNVSMQIKNVKYAIDAVTLAEKLGCKKFIGAGSQAEFGIKNTKLTSDTPADPITAYGIAKYAAGKMTKLECEQRGIQFNWARILSIYGKLDRENNLVKSIIRNARNNCSMPLSSCEQFWDYLYEDDAGRAFVAIAEKGIDKKYYNIASETPRPLKQYVEEIVSIVNPSYNPKYGTLHNDSSTPIYLAADVTELKNDTGWKPLVDFEKGIKNMLST